MKKNILKVINSVSNIGVTEDLPYIEKLKIRILNLQNLVVAVTLLLFIILGVTRRVPIFYTPFVLTIVVVLLFFYLHYKKKYILARFVLLIIFPSLILFYSYLYGEALRLEYIYYSLILIVLFYFNANWLRVLLSLFFTLIYIINLLIFEYLESPYAYLIRPGEPLIVYLSVLIGISIIIIVFYRETQKQHETQENISKKLQLKNEQLQALIIKNKSQNEKLLNLVLQNENKGKLLEILAQDIKEPTQIFNDLTEKISNILKNENPERIKELAVNIENAGSNLAFMLDNLMNWTLAQREGKKSNLQNIDVRLIVNEVVGELSYLSDAKQIRIINNVKTKIEDFVDRNLIKVMLINILHNAIKFSNFGSDIIIDYENLEKELVLKIKDFGTGMTDDYLKEVLGNKLVNKVGTNNEKGHGLGIKSCLKLLEQINSRIEIETKINKGTCVSLFIRK